MPHKTIIRLSGVARNPANGFPARPLGQAQADLDALGEGHTPTAVTGVPAPEQPQDMVAGRTWVIILAVAAVVVAVGIVAYARARRR